MEWVRKPQVLFGIACAVGIVAITMFRMTLAPSETDARAFLRQALTWSSAIYAVDISGSVVDLPSTAVSLSAVTDVKCTADGDEIAASQYICQYWFLTADGETYRTALRANFQPTDGLAQQAIPGGSPLVDPARYRVGNFLLTPLGQAETVQLLEP